MAPPMGMERYDYLIVGGGIAGVSAAEAIRSRDVAGMIAIISREPHMPYSRVLLPSYVKGRIGRERLFLRTGEKFADAGIDFFSETEAISVDAARRRVRTRERGMFSFGKLLIASGGKVRDWPHGGEAKRIYRLQTIEDADTLVSDMPQIREPLIVGSSFIALEFMEIFLAHGIVPRLLSPDARFFQGMLDREGGVLLQENCARRGVKFFFNEHIAAVEERGGAWEVATARGAVIRADALAPGIGIERAVGFLRESGVTLGERGVKTDENLETNIKGIFAAGDAAEYFDPLAFRHRISGNWTNAVMQGTRAGLNMAGEKLPYRHVPMYSIKNLGFDIAAIGECADGFETVSRRDPDGARYERFFLEGGAIAGAFLINGIRDKSHISSLVAGKVPIGRYRASLGDPGFDIHAVPLIK